MISIIITTKNEEKNITNILNSINIQRFKNYEIIVVDNNSTDKTKEISKNYGARVFNRGPERSTQRNFGVSKSRGKYVLILDADMILEQGILDELYNFAEKNFNYKCLTMKEEPIGKSFWSKCKKLELEFYTQKEDFNLAPRWFTKEIYLENNGFDENLTGPEDWDLPERIYKKYQKKYLSKKRVFHNEGDYGLFKILKKKFYYAQKINVYQKKHKISIINWRFIYFLRPEFYRYPKLWKKNLIVSCGLIYLLLAETLAGSLGFIYSKFRILKFIGYK